MDIVKWYHLCLPCKGRGFDSPYPHLGPDDMSDSRLMTRKRAHDPYVFVWPRQLKESIMEILIYVGCFVVGAIVGAIVTLLWLQSEVFKYM